MANLSVTTKTKAFVDTTVLADALLKPGPARKAALAGLARFAETELAVYAIKEFKAGPLSYYRWLHNVFAQDQSYSKAIARILGVLRTRNRASTALEAVATLAATSTTTLGALQSKYGDAAMPDRVAADEMRIALRGLIFKAWRKRRRITTRVVNPLSCYAEREITDERGLIVLGETKCTLEPNCCMAKQFRADLTALRALLDEVSKAKEQSPKPEHQRRYKVLRQLHRTSRPISDKECRSLGDAVFAFFAPVDATILTTNVQDHLPLASAVGKTVERP